MTQLELPPISFARYLDLLKRRRWQVLPVTVLGLLVGAVVAFFIPRYYVCETVVEYRGSVLGAAGGKDPMLPLVDAARVSIRYTVGEALRELSWPEMTGSDGESQRAFEKAVRARVQVIDMSPQAGRTTANLKIQYKDTDGVRAKELTETLRDTWVRSQLAQLKEKADHELAQINERIGVAMQSRDHAERELTAYAKAQRINPQDFQGRRDGVLDAKSAQLVDLETRIGTTEARRDGLLTAIETRRDQLAKTPAKTTQVQPVAIPAALQQAIDSARTRLLRATLALARVNESHPDHGRYLQMQRETQAELQQLQEVASRAAPTAEIDNPDHVRLRGELDKLETDLGTAEAELRRQRRQETALRAEIARLPEVLRGYWQLLDARQRAQADLDQLQAARRTMEADKALLTRTEPYRVLERAQVPPRPTEPNIMLVALAGSAVGLAFAIGLVLLIDILQTTFKTVEDVQRLLPIPVLGGMSYLVTAERRRQVHVRRTKVGVVAGVFLLLMVSLITIYYVAPARLPPMVRDTLGLILGAAGPASPPR